MNLTTISIIVLGGIGLLSAILLYIVSRIFSVREDPRIDEIERRLPGANCGACGYKGCRDFAVQCVRRGNLEGMNCPGAGSDGMTRVAEALGVKADNIEERVAVIRCSGTCLTVPRKRIYDGLRTCSAENLLGSGPTDCAYGCLSNGDCIRACAWNAITPDHETGIPVIDPDKCTGCGLCASACPRNIIELLPKRARTWISCVSHDRGAVSRKICPVSCIACGKCARNCPQGAITVADNCAHIDASKCVNCGQCVEDCPDKTIHIIK